MAEDDILKKFHNCNNTVSLNVDTEETTTGDHKLKKKKKKKKKNIHSGLNLNFKFINISRYNISHFKHYNNISSSIISIILVLYYNPAVSR